MSAPKYYDLGEVAHVTLTIRDRSGIAQDPTGLTFAYTDPSNNTTTYTYGSDAQLHKTATGDYYVDIVTDERGRWTWEYVGTGTNGGARAGSFNVE